MTDAERKEAIKEVLKWVKSGKQDLQNGADEIETINYNYTLQQAENLNIPDVVKQSKQLFCNLNPHFQKYLIEQGETHCSQCGGKLKDS